VEGWRARQGDEDGLAARILTALDITLERARDQLVPGSADQAPPPFLHFTPETQKVLELALSEEPTRQPHHVGTEYMLLGLIGAHEQTLLDLGVEPGRTREEVQRVLSARRPDEPYGP